MQVNYAEIEDITDHILSIFRFDFWLPEESYFEISVRTKRKYKNQNNWISIGIQEPDEPYDPLWDIYAPTDKHVEIVKKKLKSACLKLGGRYARKIKHENT